MKVLDIHPTTMTDTGQEGSIIIQCDKCLGIFVSSYFLGDLLNDGYTKEKSEEIFKQNRLNYCPFCGKEINWDDFENIKSANNAYWGKKKNDIKEEN